MNENQQHPSSAAPVPAVAAKPTRTLALSADPAEQCKQAKDLHLYTVGGMIIGAIADAGNFLKTPDMATASMVAEGFLNELIRSIRPRDAVEEMLVIQMAFVHQRIANLSLKAAEQEQTKNVAVVNHALDQACNTFRKQMLALAEYRRNANPTRQSARAQNMDEDSQDENRANELGFSPPAPPAPAALPTFRGGIDVPSRVGAAASALGAEHGPANGNGQGSLAAERAEARRVQRRTTRGTPRDERGNPAGAQGRRRIQ